MMFSTGGAWRYIYPRAKKIFRDGICTAEQIVQQNNSDDAEGAAVDGVTSRDRARVYADCLAEFKKALAYR